MAGLQEELHVNRGVVYFWATAIIVAVLACWLVALFVVHRRPHGPTGLPPTPGGQAPTFGVLNQNMFEEVDAGSGVTLEAEGRAELERWSWNDDGHTHAHVPIQRAKELLISSQRGGPDAGH